MLLPILLCKVSWVPKIALCELYVVKFFGKDWHETHEAVMHFPKDEHTLHFGVPSWLYTILHSVLWRVLQNLKHV